MRVIRVVQLPNSTVFSRPFPSPLSPATQQPTTPLISLTDSSESTPSSVHQELTPADLSSEATAGKSSLALRFVRFTRLPAPPPSRSRVSSSRSWSKDRVLRYYGILRVGSGFHSRVVRPSSYVFLLRRRTRALILSHRMTSPSPRASLTTGTSEPPSFGCNGSLKSCTLFSTAAKYVPSGIRLVQSLGQRPPPHPSTTTTTIRITTPTPQTTPASPLSLPLPVFFSGFNRIVPGRLSGMAQDSTSSTTTNVGTSHHPTGEKETLDTSFIIGTPPPLTTHCVQAPATTACPSLRATRATKDMKKMMGVFHLDPFIFKGGSWQQEENTGLKEKLVCFQLHLDFDLENAFE